MSLNVNNNVGYTVVDGGNIHIENGIVSGFSADDYLKLSSSFNLNTVNTFELKTKITNGERNYYTGICGSSTGYGCLGLRRNVNGTLLFRAGCSPSNAVTSSIALNTNVSYYVIATFNLSTLTATIGVSTDNINWTIDTATFDSSGNWWIDYRFGITQDGTFNGLIDLNSTYIKVNGITWFNGKQQASPTVNEVYLNRNVGYDIVGNPTIVDGVLSESSTGNYIKPSSNVPLSKSSSWEFVSRFQVKANTTGSHFLADFAVEAKGFDISITSTSLFWELGNASGSNWQYGKTISYTFDPTIFYSVKLSFDGNLYSIWLKTDTTQWTKLDEYASTTSVGTSYYNAFGYSIRFAGRAFNGSIDLNNTYVKVNGVTWFSGKEQASPTVNEVYLNRNVGYAIVGNLTIVDGMASGFSSSDYLKITPGFNANANNFETVIRAKPNSADGLICVGSGGVDQWKILFKSNRLWFIPTKQADSTLKIETTFDTSKFYFIKATKEGSKGTISYSEDGRTWQGLVSQDNMSWGSGANNIIIGYSSNYPVSFNGEVDLNNTYIKVNGVTWFNGKDVNFSNQNNYIINNGNLIWANPNLWLESSGTQYIDTGYTPIQYDEIKTDIMFTSSNFSIVRTIFSAGTGNYQLIFGPYDTKTYFKYFAQGGASEINFLPNINTWYSLNIDENGVCSFGGYTTTSTYTSALDGDNTTMYLFMRRNNASSFIGKLKSFIIKNKGIIKKHFVPVPKGLVIGNYTVPSNGMWDIVSQTFFANQGTGNFTFGKDGTTPVWTR